ncbi:AAA domain-containing protein [Peptococcaceae bacterium 1198_IL3148]
MINHEDIVINLKAAIKDEIECKRASMRTKKRNGVFLKDGSLLRKTGDQTIYLFKLEKPVNLPKDVPGYLFVGKVSYPGSVVSLTEDELLWCSALEIKLDNIKSCYIVVKDDSLLLAMHDKLEDIFKNKFFHNQVLVEKIFCDKDIKLGRDNCSQYLRVPQNLNVEQEEAFNRAVASEVLFIWGPPGTGKSKTLSAVVDTLYRRGKKILLVSHTHAAVDSLLKKAMDYFTPEEINKGVIMRYGAGENSELDKIIPGAIINNRIKILVEKLDIATEEKAKLDNRLNRLKTVLPLLQELNVLNDKKTRLECQSSELRSVISIKEKRIDELTCAIVTIEDQYNAIAGKLAIFRIFYHIKQKLLERNRVSINAKLDETRNNLQDLKGQYSSLQLVTENVISTIKKCEAMLNRDNLKDVKAVQIQGEIQQLGNRIRELNSLITDYQKQINQVEDKIWKNNKILGATLTAAVLNSQIYKGYWDTVIIDELSIATSYTVLLAAGFARRSVILCGDFYQLSPIAEGRSELVSTWLKSSVFDIKKITQKISAGVEVPELVMLKYQYRTHPVIADSISELVYKGRLLNGLPSDHENFKGRNGEPLPGEPLILIDISKAASKAVPPKEGSGSLMNKTSANVIANIVRANLERGYESIGVITPFRAQCNHIKEHLKKIMQDPGAIPVATVHKFQGSEKDIIIFDLVEAGISRVSRLTKGEHGTEAMRLINVAATRTKGKMIVIADVSFYRRKLGTQDITRLWLENIYKSARVIDWEGVVSSIKG